MFSKVLFTVPAISTFETSIAVSPRPTEGHSVTCLDAQELRDQLILTAGSLAVPQHSLDYRADLRPDVGPRLAGAAAERLRMLVGAQAVAPPIIVDLDELRPPPDRSRQA